ncbi:MAG: AlkZ family DNA glycosylase [Anaerolineae bacterium]|nr:AlkZ family DNA glycosylase [Anaerolineae bacterium]
MTIFDIAHLRLNNQGIAPAVMRSPGDVVRRLGAVQAQDYLGTLWALGLRMQQAVEADIEQAIANREIVRTWPMRGTLHFVAPKDVRWMLALLTPRIIAKTARRHQQLELDEATFDKSETVFAEALQGGNSLTRPEIMAVLEQAGISTKGQRGYHMLWRAAQNGLICFGPRQGKQDTFVWLDDWVPAGPSLSRDESLSELARRYFTGHGPATVQDFIWWSGLLTADARDAVEMIAPELAEEVIDGQTYWLASTDSVPKAPSPTVFLLPGFDEYLLGYRDRSAVLDPVHANKIAPGGNGMFNPTIVIDGQVIGTWKRTLRKKMVTIELQPFNPLSDAESDAVATAAEGYGMFLNRPVSLNFEI